MFKVRGVFATESEANKHAEYLIEEVDSYHAIYHCNVGKCAPFTNQKKFAKNVHSVDIKKKAVEIVSEDILEQKKNMEDNTNALKEREKKY